MPYPSEHSCRLADPSGFDKDTFRRKKSGNVSLIMAKKPGKDTMELQAIRYPIGDWDEKAARESCQEKGGTFEPASKEEKMKEISAEELIGLAEQNPELSDFQLVEKALGEGQGVGGPKQGVGGVGMCYCSNCDKEFPHERGTPCSETPCPECGAMMGPVLEEETKFQIKSVDFEVLLVLGEKSWRLGKKWDGS